MEKEKLMLLYGATNKEQLIIHIMNLKDEK